VNEAGRGSIEAIRKASLARRRVSHRAVRGLCGLVTAIAVIAAAGCGSSSHSSTAGSSSGSSPAPSGTPYVIGVEGSFSGEFAASTAQPEMIYGVWQQWVNAHGGIDGHPVQVIVKDDGGNPSEALANTQGLLTDHIIAFLGASLAGNFDPLMVQAHIPYIGGYSFNSQGVATLSAVDFPLASDTTTLTAGTVETAKRLGSTKDAAIVCTSNALCNTAGATLKAAAAFDQTSDVATLGVSTTAPNYTAQCLAARNAGATAVEIGTDAVTAAHVASDCAQQGYSPTWMAVDGPATNTMLNTAALDGLVSGQSMFPWFSDAVPGMAEFWSALKKYAPSILPSSEFGPNDVDTWAGLQMFAAAASHLGNNPTAGGVFQGLYSLKNETLGGLIPPVNYVAGQTEMPTCYFAIQIKNHQWTLPFGTSPQCPAAGVPK
jgi:branched-chain amino acid transport system substrate-binding protein